MRGNGSLPSEDAVAATRVIAEARRRLSDDPARTALLDWAIDELGEVGLVELAKEVAG
jgi:hypothetical protein